MKAPVNNGEFEQPDAGTYDAILYKIVDLGTQPGGDYMGEKQSDMRKVVLFWEIPASRTSQDKPHIINKWYSFVMGERANLRKDITSWRGGLTDDEAAEFDIEDMLEEGFTLSVGLNKKGNRMEIKSVTGMTENSKAALPALYNPVFVFDLDNYDQDKFDQISERLQKYITPSSEYAKAISGESPKSEPVDEDVMPDDECPF